MLTVADSCSECLSALCDTIKLLTDLGFVIKLTNLISPLHKELNFWGLYLIQLVFQFLYLRKRFRD